MGLASGFIEPLESTAIHLIQVTIQRLILLFPHVGDYEARRLQFNRQRPRNTNTSVTSSSCTTTPTTASANRSGMRCRNMSIPDSLAHKLELFRETAGIFCASEDLFQLSSWLQVMWGQGVRPRGTHPFVEAIAPHDRAGYLRDLRHLFAQAAQTLPSQADFIAQHCAATPPAAALTNCGSSSQVESLAAASSVGRSDSDLIACSCIKEHDICSHGAPESSSSALRSLQRSPRHDPRWARRSMSSAKRGQGIQRHGRRRERCHGMDDRGSKYLAGWRIREPTCRTCFFVKR